jgi:hypothetical protein
VCIHIHIYVHTYIHIYNNNHQPASRRLLNMSAAFCIEKAVGASCKQGGADSNGKYAFCLGMHFDLSISMHLKKGKMEKMTSPNESVSHVLISRSHGYPLVTSYIHGTLPTRLLHLQP